MNKLIAALIAGAFAFASVTALGQDDKAAKAAQRQQDLKAQESQATNQPPTTPTETKALNAAAAKAKAAKAEFAKMSPEEQAAYKKGMAAQRQMDLQGQEAQATPHPATTPEQQKAINALKPQPKALPTKDAKQDALKQQEQTSTKGGGGN